MLSSQFPRELQLNVHGMNFAAQEWGTPDQLPVLALHGWLDNSSSFYALAPRLKNLHIVAVDLAGHGRSDRRPGHMAYTPWDDICDLFAIADYLGWERFAFLGHSRGAIISTLAAGAFPERILCLGLVEGLLPEAAPAEDAPKQLARAINGLRNQKQKSPSVYPDMEVAIKARERGMFPLSYEAAKALTERGVVAQSDGFSWSTDPRLLAPSIIRLAREQLAAFVNNINMPVRLLLATDGLPKLYPNYLNEVARFPHIGYELLEGGHHLHMEQEVDLVAAKLNEFFTAFIDAESKK
ncbi:alpha/beta hydrolase [Cellvibrio mixtus]|uniref:alpha/beta hydrolase n=1 Tax=Cellvibrio mixtus TaxID=39650 RepID=UPI000587125E|nr:alpha/beta hydrolase [Cellvibrio mixtus]